MHIKFNVSDAMAKVLAMMCLACVGIAHCSVLVPTYVLPPASFPQPRDQRSLQSASQGVRTLARLAGGHLKLQPSNHTNKIPTDPAKTFANHAKNTFAFVEKENKNRDEKFAGIVVKTENQNVGWNQGQWDDGMLMSSAGNGKEKNKKKTVEDDEDKKTLADQVAEGKYGLIQKELFVKTPSRPGVLSYTANPETKAKDNEQSLGGLKSEEIWLAEDHLLVLKGGSFPEHNNKASESSVTWAPIDAYQAPPRQVKIPQNPEVPPPFPVRLSDNGPLVFLTPNGSIPAPLFPARPPGAGFGLVPAAPPPYPPSSAPPSPNAYPGNPSAGGSPFPIAPYPYFPPRNESEFPFPFPGPINGSFPGGLPPGASFLPPPGNLSDLYDEDDPSIYYPPPYSFSYQADNTSKVPAGPLVPGIVLPPPPDFFARLEPTRTTPTTTRPTAHAYAPTPPPPSTTIVKTRPHSVNMYLPPTTNIDTKSPNSVNIADKYSTTPPKTVTSQPTPKTPSKVVISKPSPIRKTQTTTTASPNVIKTIKFTEKHPSPITTTILHKPIKTTLKPVSPPVTSLYYPENYYDENTVSPSPRPFLVYGPPDRSQVNPFTDKAYVTSTPVPLRAYYSNPNYDNILPQIQFAKQKAPSITRIRPDFLQSTGQNGKSVASFYFYEEPGSKAPNAAPNVADYFDGRNYYQTINNNAQQVQNEEYTYNQGGFGPASNIEFKPVPSREPSPFFFIPQRQGSRTLTQEYFSVQKPKIQNNYVQQVSIPQKTRPESFYDQIANIQQTIDYYTTHRPKNIYRQASYRDARQKPKPTPRPVYQFSYQSNNGRPEQNTFRAPEMDSEPFRPMVAYSKPYNVQNEYESAPKTVYSVENLKVTTESPQSSRYYTTAKTNDYDYEDINQEKKTYIKSNTPTSIRAISSSLKSKKVQILHPTTKNPIDHAYYTKQEEGLFDDITKKYFTIFGQKIEQSNIDGTGIAVTAPISPIGTSTVIPPIDNRVNVQYGNGVNPESQSILSLASDTQVNYRQPRPLINPESEFIPIVNPEIQAKYEAEQRLRSLKEQNSKSKVKNVEIIKSEGFEHIEKLNKYNNNEQLELVRPVVPNRFIQQNSNNYKENRGPRTQVAEGRPGSLVAYRLPGEGAHVYFLTPQPTRNDYRTAEEIAALS
ncbi:uncharacterized protein LOC143915207 [Arctopsyche grandis]|uniref:uncharacterized protein LOC143915207 n=1 Tax=Arctopsyche grandis TaxID=121162 RepID=UPI00406DA19D